MAIESPDTPVLILPPRAKDTSAFIAGSNVGDVAGGFQGFANNGNNGSLGNPLNVNLDAHTFPTTDFSNSSANQPWTIFTVPFGGPLVFYSITYPPNGDVIIVPVTSTGARTSYYPVPPPDLTDYSLRIYALGRAAQTVTAELNGFPTGDVFTGDVLPGQIERFDGLNGANSFFGVSDRPIVGDFDQDGIDDLGVWFPTTPWRRPARTPSGVF